MELKVGGLPLHTRTCLPEYIACMSETKKSSYLAHGDSFTTSDWLSELVH